MWVLLSFDKLLKIIFLKNSLIPIYILESSRGAVTRSCRWCRACCTTSCGRGRGWAGRSSSSSAPRRGPARPRCAASTRPSWPATPRARSHTRPSTSCWPSASPPRTSPTSGEAARLSLSLHNHSCCCVLKADRETRCAIYLNNFYEEKSTI